MLFRSSEFANPGPLLDDDDALEAIWKKQYSLAEFVAPDQFKTYDELKARLHSVLGSKTSVRLDEEQGGEEEYSRGSTKELDDDLRSEINNLKPTRRAAVDDDDDDDALSYFSKLAAD